MAERPNILHNLNKVIMGNSVPALYQKNNEIAVQNPVIYSTNDKAEYDAELLKIKQQKLLAHQWVKAGVDSTMEGLAGQQAVKLMYRDADLMETFPEIGTALDIYSEEACLGGDTKIKLFNDETRTIRELYDGGYCDFWCYAVNENGECIPTHIEKVINKGIRETYKIGLDDDTFIECTPDHLWLLSDGTWIKTEDLIPFNSLMGISENSNYRNNHCVLYIDKTIKPLEVYDLVNSSTNSCFAVKCNEGHVISHNCNINSKGKMLNIYSKSPRIKAVLEDLFINRLNINTTLPMVTRGMCKYGNEYRLLNLDLENGVMGWKRIVPYEIDRIENGINAYGGFVSQANTLKPDETTFVWLGHNESMPFKDYQIAHFRMLQDSFFLPYGCSLLHKARRAWRMLSLMEDAMLIYRLDKSVERRVFKIFVGAIDDADVPAYVQEIANNFKRTPMIDPQTGQIDLRKNFMDVSTDYFIPVRREDAPNPIETLQSAQNPTAMDDIQYMQNKIFAALRVPKTFLNYQEAQGKGQNLSLLDIRFCRMVNKIQQYLLLELNKIASIHLYLLGFKDDMTNFTLSLNNPSAQIEALELEDMTKRLQTAATALADPGIGMPIFSLHKVLKEIMKMSDKEIKDMLEELRIEKAMAAELAATSQVIKKTGIFDAVDNIYGDFNSGQAPTQQQGGQEEPGAPAGGGMTGGADIGDSLHMDSLGGPGEDTSGDIGGTEESVPMSQAPNVDPNSLQEIKGQKKMITEKKSFISQYFDMLTEQQKIADDEIEATVDYIGKNMMVNNAIKEGIEAIKTTSEKLDENTEILQTELDKIKDAEEIKAMLDE